MLNGIACIDLSNEQSVIVGANTPDRNVTLSYPYASEPAKIAHRVGNMPRMRAGKEFSMLEVNIDQPLRWQQVAAVADGAHLQLAPAAIERLQHAADLVAAIVARGTRAYGINTGVGALCEVAIDVAQQRELSRNIVMSHACGVGVPLGVAETRAIITAAINNFCHGSSGVRALVVERLALLLNADAIAQVPARGSVGYLTHMAHIALVLIGSGTLRHQGEWISAGDWHRRLGLAALELEAKEGLSLVNGTPCATGLAAVALARAQRLLDWADAIGAMSFENIGTGVSAISPAALHYRVSDGIAEVGARLERFLRGSEILAAKPPRTQDALSLRAMPHVHGAAREAFAVAAAVVDRELASVTDNPIVAGSVDAPRVISQAHAVGSALALATDSLAIALAQVAAMSERRIDRLVNPLVNAPLPPFLAQASGVNSGFMIAQYTAAALVAENRRLAAPASLDGGVTSGLQEDHLSHATSAALKLLQLLDNVQTVLAIECLAAAQAYEFQDPAQKRAAATAAIYRRFRDRVPAYHDERPLAGDITLAAGFLQVAPPEPD